MCRANPEARSRERGTPFDRYAFASMLRMLPTADAHDFETANAHLRSGSSRNAKMDSSACR